MEFDFRKLIVDEGNLEEILCASSEKMREVAAEIRLYAPLDFPILIEGDSGTGKEIVARALHDLSGRRPSPFLAINIAEGSDNLFESNLFGHKKGAFTGADHARTGIIEQAMDGTLFLDEINSLPRALQPKLLRVLEERVYWPVGAASPVSTLARFLFSTNQQLSKMTEYGQFREDVLYRLGRTIRLPLLRERQEDIPCLAKRLISESSRKISEAVSRRQGEIGGWISSFKTPPVLSEGALLKLRSYPWPGNIREMKVVLERAVLVCRSRTILPEHIEFPYGTEIPIEKFDVAMERFSEDYFSRVCDLAGENFRLGMLMTGMSETSYRRKIRKYKKNKSRNRNKKFELDEGDGN
ncbi:MAG: sigma-54-dependent transcriptional regulator [Leptospirales bacterium]